MSLKSWWQERKQRRRNQAASDETRRNAPLREFVYLDAVSLHSLLVSQNATIPHEVSQAISRADEAELAGKVSGKIGSELVGATAQGETSTRYQTSNSNSVQSSRKAVIQTLFKELRDLPLEFKLAARDKDPEPLKSTEAVTTAKGPAGEPGDAFRRGTLVEVEVTLAVDPVFKLGLMMNEWTGMAGDFPAMFGRGGLLGFLHDSQPVMKILDRFLAGLIPVKATATNHVVAEIDGRDYIVHRAALGDLDVKARPLHIVGVTEHLGYWRDIRRVFFSNARFTILCRVVRDGIHNKWTPVKLADLFSDVAPDFVDTINAIRPPTAADATVSPQAQQIALGAALESYKTAILPSETTTWTETSEAAFQAVKTRLAAGPADAASQRKAFDVIRDMVVAAITEPIEGEADLKARRDAREAAGLELWPSLGVSLTSGSTQSPKPKEEPDERMLDVEVIAIYW